MGTVILFYEGKRRELDACESLKREIESNYKHNIQIFQIVFEYRKAVAYAKKNKVDMLIMPWLYSERCYYFTQPFIKLNPKLFVVNMHHEQIASEFSDCIYNITSLHKNHVIHFVWAENFKNILIKKGVKEELIFINGNIRLDSTFNVKYNKVLLAKEFNLDINKKWILLSESRGWVLNFKKNGTRAWSNLITNTKELEKQACQEMRSLENTINDIKSIDEVFYDKYELIYRPHPGTLSPFKDKEDNLRVISKYSIYEWLNVVATNIVWTSSSIFETEAFGIPGFVMNTPEIEKKFIPFGLEKYPHINKINEIDTRLDCFEFQKNKIYPYYIGECEGKNIKKTGELIDIILKTGIKNYQPKKIKCSYKLFRFNLWIALLNLVTKLTINLNLIEKIKFPKSAFDNLEDIPYYEKRKVLKHFE
ncbi:hypothetical protein ACH52_1362 [Eubacterium limosum]|nr:hypothetical protein ACH52_1362 [Eubacterium limosum]